MHTLLRGAQIGYSCGTERMNFWPKLAIAIGLVALLASALLNVLSALLAISIDAFPPLADPDDHE
jgi:hypothetical protein